MSNCKIIKELPEKTIKNPTTIVKLEESEFAVGTAFDGLYIIDMAAGIVKLHALIDEEIDGMSYVLNG